VRDAATNARTVTTRHSIHVDKEGHTTIDGKDADKMTDQEIDFLCGINSSVG